jgi:hypothetical protein
VRSLMGSSDVTPAHAPSSTAPSSTTRTPTNLHHVLNEIRNFRSTFSPAIPYSTSLGRLQDVMFNRFPTVMFQRVDLRTH